MKRILLLGVALALALALGWGLFGGATGATLPADGGRGAAPLPPNLTPTPTPTPGCGWNIVDSPNNILAFNNLQAMAGLGSTDIWAVGYSEDLLAGLNQTVVQRWNGVGWAL